MPIEIRELVIRATVDPGEAGGGGCGEATSPRPDSAASADESGPEESVVQACVREVLRILEEKRER